MIKILCLLLISMVFGCQTPRGPFQGKNIVYSDVTDCIDNLNKMRDYVDFKLKGLGQHCLTDLFTLKQEDFRCAGGYRARLTITCENTL